MIDSEYYQNYQRPNLTQVILNGEEDITEKIKYLNTDQFVLKAQIHAGGRGKAGGVKLVKKKDIVDVAKQLFGKVLVTPQTGPEGRVVKRIYIQKAANEDQKVSAWLKRARRLQGSGNSNNSIDKLLNELDLGILDSECQVLNRPNPDDLGHWFSGAPSWVSRS